MIQYFKFVIGDVAQHSSQTVYSSRTRVHVFKARRIAALY